MLEPIEKQYQKIGYISRSHGVEGDVLIVPDVYAPTLFDTLDLVHIENTRGDLIPARVESVRVQEKNNRLSFFVKFEHVNDRTQAEELKNHSVYTDRILVENLPGSDDTLPDFTSFEIWSSDEFLGTVEGMLDNPAHPILRVLTNEQKELLIPLVDEYVTEIDEESKRIKCQNLKRLLSL